MEMQNSKRDRWLTAGFLAGVFLFMFIFFYHIHPLVILDADDWTYVSYTRLAVPAEKYWNPARILPEIFMSGCSTFSAFVLRPLTGDYIRALSLGYALVLSAILTAYTWCFVRLAEKKIGLERGWNLLAAVLFLLFHFLIFRTENSNNSYMLRSCNVTCYFYYTIPGLLNCSLLMYFLAGNGPDTYLKEGSALKKGWLLLLVYLAVFSNLYESIILATYAGCVVLLGLIRCLREKESLPALIREKAVSLGILVLWVVSAVFEFFGERAGEMVHTESFGELLGQVLTNVKNVLAGMNAMFVLLALGLASLAVTAAVLGRKKGERDGGIAGMFTVLVLCGAIVTVYIILLGAKTAPKYIDLYRADLLYGMLFFPVVLMTLCGVYCMKRFPWLKVLVPLMIVILGTEVNTPLVTFAESNMIFTPHEKVAEMSRDVVDQIVAADKEGRKQAEIFVSDAATGDNWPQATYMGPRIVASLQKHGLISGDMELTIVPSAEFNEKYGLDFG